MTDILIPLGAGSRYDNIELRYCLRSIEKHLSGVGRVFIVGELPDFINPESVIFIPLKESTDNKHRAWNIYNKIMAGINYRSVNSCFNDDGKRLRMMEIVELSDNFLFMNDDHFLLSDFEASEFPYFHRGVIETHRMPNEAQRIQYENTVNCFGDGADFGVHAPILYGKEYFKYIFLGEVWHNYGFEIKSAYARLASNTEKCMLCEDLKFTQPVTQKESIYRALEGRQWFSIGDAVLRNGIMQEVLHELYSLPSKYER